MTEIGKACSLTPFVLVMGLSGCKPPDDPPAADTHESSTGVDSAESGTPPDTADTSDTSDTTDTSDTADSGDPPPPEIRAGLVGLDDLHVQNVIVMHVDTLRRDKLTAYGYDRDTMPHAADYPWLVVEDYYANSSWTVPSTTSMLTGLRLSHHGVVRFGADGGAPVLGDPTIATHLHDAGFATYFGLGNQPYARVGNIENGFDEVALPVEEGGRLRAVDLVDGAADWLDSLPDGQPFFMVLQPMDMHAPYDPGDFLGTWSDADNLPFTVGGGITEDEQREEFNSAYGGAYGDDAEHARILQALRDVYDEDILRVDVGIRKLMQELDERGLRESTLVVLTADHGDTLGEDLDVYFGHGGTTRPELVRIPLLFSHPWLTDQMVSCLSENTSLAPTIIQALGVEPMDGLDGAALQLGCDATTITRASTFENDTDGMVPLDVEVTDGNEMLRYNCYEAKSMAYDLTVDPLAQNGIPKTSLVNYDALLTAMNEFTTDLVDDLGADRCIPE